MKISFFSFACNTNFPLDIMYRQFQKYMKEPFEFILFNDAFDPKMEKDVNTIATCNKIPCVRVPQSIHKVHNPSACYAATLNWALHEYAPKHNCEIVVLMHCDVFPICDVSISDILGDSVVASTPEFRLIDGKGINYFYPAFTVVNMKLLKNVKELDFSLLPGMDVGGKTKEFIEKYPNSYKFIPNHQAAYFLATLDGKGSLAEYFKADLEITRETGLSSGWIAAGFYHYLCGSGWNKNQSSIFAVGHQKRNDLFLRYFY